MSKSKPLKKNSSFDSQEILQDEIDSLSYKESISSLDEILDLLQNESVDVEELENYYLRASLYLEHCEKLLKNVEQEVIKIEPEELLHGD